MQHDIYYKSASGEVLRIGRDGIYMDAHDMMDYSWEGTHRNLLTRNIPLWFMSEKRNECLRKRDEAYRIFDRDKMNNVYGRLYVNGFYLSCRVTSAKNEEFLESGRWIKTTFEFEVEDGRWIEEKQVDIIEIIAPQEDDHNSGCDLPVDLPFDLSKYIPSNGIFTNENHFPSDFILTFYGPCDDPTVIINDHVYGIRHNLSEYDTIIVNSTKNGSITMIGQDGIEVNAFNYRYKPQSIYEKIPTGECRIMWTEGTSFSLTLLNSRSEPPWFIEEEVISELYYLRDSDGAYITDSDGERIEVDAL